MSKTKLFEELLCLDIFQEEGGLPNSKKIEELFCLSLDIYQKWGGMGRVYIDVYGSTAK